MRPVRMTARNHFDDSDDEDEEELQKRGCIGRILPKVCPISFSISNENGSPY